MKPLTGIRVVDFSQFLAGPACSLRLADLGAEVIKIERPETGDICRHLYIAKQKIGGESTLFHAINRNKKSLALDLKNAADRQKLYPLIQTADVVVQNFRPGVAKRLDIDYNALKQINPRIVYASISGYGADNSLWHQKPGQDLLAQALSGITYTNDNTRPCPLGLSIADLTTAYDVTQGILSLLVRRGRTGTGGHTEVSLIETLISYQAIQCTHFLNTYTTKSACEVRDIYQTQDGYIAVLAPSIAHICTHINAPDIADRFKTAPTAHWLDVLQSDTITASAVYNWHHLRQSEHYRQLHFEQTVTSPHYPAVHTTRCPLKIDGQYMTSPQGIATIGEHNQDILTGEL